MKIFLGSDHAGFDLKQKIHSFLQEKHYIVKDLGCYNTESCDYPDFGIAVGEAVAKTPNTIGIILCGSGIGISIAANKVKGVRAALANSIELARLARQHNGANILALGGRTQFIDPPLEIVETFLSTKVDQQERHKRRRKKLNY